MTTQPNSVLRLPWARRFSSAALLLAAFVACGSPANNAALFTASGTQPAAGSATGVAAAGGEDAGIAGTGPTNAGGSSSDAGAPPSAGGPSAGSSQAGGGSANGGDGGVSGTASAGNGGTQTECSAHGDAATYFSKTQHCYLVVHDLITFADAQTHCNGLGAHLATIANEDEDAFVWSLDTAEHWIGTTDGKGPKEPDPGTYTWLTGEPFNYSNWSADQPNAFQTTCGDSNGGGDCYEHCGFQWSGGEQAGQWNDRYCMHTIESVCEWDH
jgi:hypothetical protein